MPAYTKCRVPGCTFDGPHGFTGSYRGMMLYYHSIKPGVNYPSQTSNHFWYSVTLPNGTKLETTSQSEAFEKGVVPAVKRDGKPGTDEWIEMCRAEIKGDTKAAAKWKKAWHKANNID